MKSSIQEKLDRFQHLLWRQTAEFTLETLFLFETLLFLLASLPDFFFWRWYFQEFSGMRWSFWGVAMVGLIWELIRSGNRFRRLPRSRTETFHVLRGLELKAQTSFAPQRKPLPRSLENALDFLENPQPAESRKLCEAVIAQTEKAMADFQPHEWLKAGAARPPQWLLRALTLLAVLGLGALTALCEENASVALKRFAMPWDSVPWQVEFRPQWRTLPKEVLAGETFDAEISFRKEAAFAQVAVWDSANASEPLQILKVEPVFGRYRLRVPNVKRSFFISLFLPGENPASVASQTRHQVRVRTLPQLRNAILRLQPPAVTRRPPRESGWEITGVTGSRTGIMIAADRPLKEAKIRFSDETYVPGEPAGKKDPAGNSSVFKFRFELLRDCEYFLELTDPEGQTARLESHSIHVLEDQPPTVSCEFPPSGRLFLPGAKIQLRLEAQDDFGVEALGFRWVAESPISPNSTQASSPLPSISADGFVAPRTTDGTLKWTGFMVWSASEPDSTSQKPNSASVPPFSHQATYDWDLTSLSLQPGMRLRLEPVGVDANAQRAFGSERFFFVTSPEEMQLKAFRQWLGITQEMRRIGNLLLTARQRLTTELTSANLPEISEGLSQGMAEINRLLNPALPDALPQMLELLERDLNENPEFPFHENVTSKNQLHFLRQLRKTLAQIQAEPLPDLNQEIVQLARALQLQEEKKPAVRGTRIAQKLDRILKLLRPMMKIWNREEHLGTMRSELEGLTRRQEAIFERLNPLFEQAAKFSPMEVQTRNQDQIQTALTDLWNLRQDLELFLLQFRELLEPETDVNAKTELKSESDSEHSSPSCWKENASTPALGNQLIRELETSLNLLQTHRFWDLQRLKLQIQADFAEASLSWAPPASGNPVRDRLRVFGQMLASEEKILHLLEACTEPAKTTVQNQVKVVPLTRNLRKAFQDCARIHEKIAASFQNSSETDPEIPQALLPLWQKVCENLQISINDFRTISSNSAPPLELLQDQYSMQLQIYDQFAELSMIVDGMPTEMSTWSRNSQFENRISETDDSEKTKFQKESENEAGASSKNPPNPKESDANSETAEGASQPEITPADIQILISMQQSVLEQTETLAKNSELSMQQKASELEFLTGQEQKIAASAELLGFGAHPNSSFAGLLAQIHQVAFLLEKQDLGTMTQTIQEEIIYGLQASLQSEEAPEDAEKANSEKTSYEPEDLSENADSQAPESMNPDQTETQTETNAENQNQTSDEAKEGAAPDENLLPASEMLRQLQNSFWGELPMRQQKELERLPKEKPIPGYQQMLEIYYRNLRQ